MRWIAEQEATGVLERSFVVPSGDRLVPGILWSPPRAVPAGALVAIGHGGSGHKRQDYVLALARRLVRHHGFAAVAIDGPVHGDRRADGGRDERLTLLEFAQTWRSDPTMTDRMVEDWQATVAGLRQLDEVAAAPLGYWGLSMGTIVGLSFVATEPTVGAAVLGLMGLTGPTRARVAADAPRVCCPVLFLVQQSDELFPRTSALDLFDALGTTDKRLHLNLGAHGAVPGHELEDTETFLARHLAPRAQPAGGPAAVR